MVRSPINENFVLQPPARGQALYGESVRSIGLDPRLYAAAIPAECGRAGRVNENNRIYPIDSALREHIALNERAQRQVVEGEIGHPEHGETWTRALRYLGGDYQIEADGSVLFRGWFGVLDTALGRDIVTMYEAGFPIGVSHRAWGVKTPHKIDDSSPYLRANPSHKGATVDLIEHFELETYDWVRHPSAGTFVLAPKLGESYNRICEALERGAAKKEAEMTYEELLKNHPALVESMKGRFQAESAATVESTKAQVVDLEAKLKAANEALASRTDENKTLADKIKASELTAAAKDTAVQALSERLAALEADAARNSLREQVRVAVNQAMTGQPVGALICKHVEQEFDSGRFAKVEEAVAAANEKLAFAKAAMAVGPGAASVPATQGTPPAPVNEGALTGTPPGNATRSLVNTVSELMN